MQRKLRYKVCLPILYYGLVCEYNLVNFRAKSSDNSN